MPLVDAPNPTVRPTRKDAIRALSASPMHRAPGHADHDPSTRAAKESDRLMPPISTRKSETGTQTVII